MNKEDFIKIGEDTIRCDECAFCEDCEIDKGLAISTEEFNPYKD